MLPNASSPMAREKSRVAKIPRTRNTNLRIAKLSTRSYTVHTAQDVSSDMKNASYTRYSTITTYSSLMSLSTTMLVTVILQSSDLHGEFKPTPSKSRRHSSSFTRMRKLRGEDSESFKI